MPPLPGHIFGVGMGVPSAGGSGTHALYLLHCGLISRFFCVSHAFFPTLLGRKPCAVLLTWLSPLSDLASILKSLVHKEENEQDDPRDFFSVSGC